MENTARFSDGISASAMGHRVTVAIAMPVLFILGMLILTL